MNPCFICGTPTEGYRSLTQITAPPTSPHDAVPICHDCHQDWSISLLALVRLELAGLNALAHPKQDAPDPRKNNHPTKDS